MSSAIYFALFYTVDLSSVRHRIILHPYPMGALISALTFLLAFRANFSYNRYWESMTTVYQMHSKWLDVGMELAAFHLQAAVYQRRRPPAFGRYPEIRSLERERERLNEPTMEELEEQLNNMDEEIAEQDMTKATSSNNSGGFTPSGLFRRKRSKTISHELELPHVAVPPPIPPIAIPSKNLVPPAKPRTAPPVPRAKSINAVVVAREPSSRRGSERQQPLPQNLPRRTSLSHAARIFHSVSSPAHGSNNNNNNSPAVRPEQQQPQQVAAVAAGSGKVQTSSGHHRLAWDADAPPLFLQEAAHLLSLLSAVAFSTLRNDLEQADSPLITFVPGAPWPHVDPDAYTADVRKDWAVTGHRTLTVLRFVSGWSRTTKTRTLYNAARPFRVIGGVSDAEIEILQAARGPLAKVALVTLWLQEFITRESLAGSTGDVAPPILSRLYQFISDGMLGYNHARKIAYIPFPFAHSRKCSIECLCA